MNDEVLPAALDGERVDRVVAMLTGCSRSEAADAISAGTVFVDDRPVTKASLRLLEGQRVRVEGDPIRVVSPPAADPDVAFSVLHADDHVIVVDKPAGLVVHPGAAHSEATLVHGLLSRFPELATVGGDPLRPGIVHRLDKGTSGLLVVARNADAFESLVDQLATHEVDRHYRALVHGHFETTRGTIDAPVGRSRRDPLRMTVSATGRNARTHYEVTSCFEQPAELTLLECRLETGRTHQIRVHLRSIGRPVVGDDLYGGARGPLRLERPFLHAAQLGFVHPGTGRQVQFHSVLPPDLVAVLDTLV